MIDEELPFPPTSGKRIRTLNLTMRLAQRHRITYVCRRNADAGEAREAAAYFADHGVLPIVVDGPVPRRSGVLFYARLATNLLSPLPYSVASHRSRALEQALREIAVREPVDLWHCEWTPYAAALRGLNGAPRLVMAHNVESVIWQRYHETETNPLKRWYVGRQWRKYQRFERSVLGEMEQTVAVSDLDAERLRQDFGARRVDVTENGVDTEHFRPRDPAARAQTGRLLFLGSLDWRPNLDGVARLLEVFPAVRAAEPRATLVLVGRNPPDWLRRRTAEMGVELHADVPDVRPYLHDAELTVVPLRVGGGSRLKILESLAAGVPVVSTRIGAEGLHLEPGRHLTVVENIEDLAAALLVSLRAPDALEEQARRGREQVLRRYDWDVLADQLERIWLDCAGASGRSGNREGPGEPGASATGGNLWSQGLPPVADAPGSPARQESRLPGGVRNESSLLTEERTP
jgi:glycosyltransferase involved in cell wall biosynthesis